jgi:regulator of RNase E activity RraB
VDLSLRDRAPIEAKPWLLWAWVYLRMPRASGLSSEAELAVLSRIGDELAKHVGETCDAIEAGFITTDGHREFYFYGATEAGFERCVAEVMQQFNEYTFDCGKREDSEWSHYCSILCPTEEDFQKTKNIKVLQALLDHGDTLTPVRDVHHWIYFHSPGDRQLFASEVRELGYTVEHQTETPYRLHRFGLRIMRNQSVTPDQIDDAVSELVQLAQEIDADYDGWEAQVVVTRN